MQKLDILVITSHPDDAELGCGGTIAAHVAMGKKVGMIDLTRGEMGTRGTPQLRAEEAEAAKRVLGAVVRENMGFADGFFANDKEHQLALIKVIRKYQPDIVIANAVTDRHPDHARGAALTKDACFYAGLRKVASEMEGKPQEAWRPGKVYSIVQNNYIQPDIVLDISEFWKTKLEAILCFTSQFDAKSSDEPQTHLTTPIFLNFVEARAREYGHAIGVAYGEGFTVDKQIGVKSLYDLH